MKISVLGVMKTHLDQHDCSINNENMPMLLEDLKRFSGAEAGICYMSKPYFDSYVSDEVKALNRFTTVAGTGHHSIAGHSQIALLFENIPKILAMYLNNLGDYEASEKSGRYTVMSGQSENENVLYEKWCEKFRKIIYDTYNDKIDERTRDKLAKENARYLLSVFVPTTMGYTASIRQFNYIIDWSERFVKSKTPNNYFYTELKKWFGELAKQLRDILYVEDLRDIKSRVGFDMISFKETGKTNVQVGKVYNIGYYGTFAHYAQAQRHRTLFYNFQFDGISKKFYVPPIIQDTKYKYEWLDDIESLKAVVPTGTLVFIEEYGKLENFYLKSMERNCGRAQLEIMNQNLCSSYFLVSHIDELPDDLHDRVMNYYTDTENGSLCPKMKGQIMKCKEPCVWGCKDAMSRLI